MSNFSKSKSPLTRNFTSKVITLGTIAAAGLLITASANPAFSDSNYMQLPPAAPIMLTTTESVEGYRVKEYKGIVRGVTVREPGPISNFKAGLKGIVGGKIDPYIRLCETARQHAMDDMVARAQAMGANAVIGFRYDSSAFGDGDDMVTEVVCYGTAVVIEQTDKSLKAASLSLK